MDKWVNNDPSTFYPIQVYPYPSICHLNQESILLYIHTFENISKSRFFLQQIMKIIILWILVSTGVHWLLFCSRISSTEEERFEKCRIALVCTHLICYILWYNDLLICLPHELEPSSFSQMREWIWSLAIIHAAWDLMWELSILVVVSHFRKIYNIFFLSVYIYIDKLIL